jgi:hypothetical protein
MEEFQVRVMRGEYTGGIPDTDQRALRAEFLLLKIAADPSDPALLKKITAWITAA